jgi:hypothetical protein
MPSNWASEPARSSIPLIDALLVSAGCSNACRLEVIQPEKHARHRVWQVKHNGSTRDFHPDETSDHIAAWLKEHHQRQEVWPNAN